VLLSIIPSTIIISFFISAFALISFGAEILKAMLFPLKIDILL
jgi:hypothetical protein